MAKIAIYVIQNNGSARTTCEAMAEGARAIGDQVTMYANTAFQRRHLDDYDTAVMWGYIESCSGDHAELS